MLRLMPSRNNGRNSVSSEKNVPAKTVFLYSWLSFMIFLLWDFVKCFCFDHFVTAMGIRMFFG